MLGSLGCCCWLQTPARCGGLGCSGPPPSLSSSAKSSMGAESGAIAAITDGTEDGSDDIRAGAPEADEEVGTTDGGMEGPPKYFGTLRGALPSWLVT